MPDPLAAALRARTHTPQTQPIPGRETDMTANDAGGYTFGVDLWTRLHRFLVLGTDGGTYYTSEAKLTADNASVVFKAVADDGLRVVDHIRTLSDSGDTPKQQPLLFTLAVACAADDDRVQEAAFAAMPAMCRTATQLFMWNDYLEQLRGRGPRVNKAIAAWYNRDEVGAVAYQMVKYRQRGGWTHRDMLRLAKPKPASDEHQHLFAWATRGTPADPLPLVDAYSRVNEPGVQPGRAADLIHQFGLPWEAIPDRLLNEPVVWDALLPTLGATAMLRQLPRLSRIGLISQWGGHVPTALERLVDVEFLRRGRVHPVAVLNALYGYASGVSASGGEHPVSRKVVELLDQAFLASFRTIIPAGKRTLLALDVSGSMTWHRLPKLPGLTPRDAAAAMAMATVRTEPETIVVAFAMGDGAASGGRGINRLGNITASTQLLDVIRITGDQRAGGTDCSLPMLWAGHQRLANVDTFVIYTDNETWGGAMHPSQALAQYRQWSGHDARMAVVAMEATDFTIADSADSGQLDLAGFDAAAPAILSAFSRGDV